MERSTSRLESRETPGMIRHVEHEQSGVGGNEEAEEKADLPAAKSESKNAALIQSI
jgi:hypothetical protein